MHYKNKQKQGNLSKIKYFLPQYRQSNQQNQTGQSYKNVQNRTRKTSQHNLHTRSLQENTEISFEIVGISETEQPLQLSKTHQENITHNHSIAHKKKSIDKITAAGKTNKAPQKSMEASISSIRALTNSRQWKLPQGTERQQFLRFIDSLKADETYQQTITMFTMMYFYQKRNKNK